MSIFNIPDKRLSTEYRRQLKKIAKGGIGYDDAVNLLFRECKRFPEWSAMWPTIVKRKSQSISITIHVAKASADPDSYGYKQKMAVTGRPPSTVAHQRLIEGSPKYLVEHGLEIIKATKTMSEILTTLEQTCLGENTNS